MRTAQVDYPSTAQVVLVPRPPIRENDPGRSNLSLKEITMPRPGGIVAAMTIVALLAGSGGWREASSGVQAVVNYFGPTDLAVARFPDASYKILENFIGGPLEAHRDEYRRASPVVYLTADDPPVMTFQGTVDPLVPLEQAEILHRRLTQLHILNRLVILEGRWHGWPAADMEPTVQDSIAVFKRCLKGR